MEKPDSALTERLQRWLATPPAERNLLEGIEMFHVLRPTERILYRNFLSRPKVYAEKVEYHLRKHLQVRLDGLTARRVALMDQEVTENVQQRIVSGFHGRRPDHEQLPEGIRKLYDDNGVTFEKMKAVYNKLLTMEDRPSCERYEFLKVLQAEDELYNKRWEKYDKFTLTAPQNDNSTDTDGKKGTGTNGTQSGNSAQAAAAFARELAAARKFVSENLARLEEDELDEKRRIDITERTQERINFVLSSGGTFKTDYAERLKAQGLEPTAPCLTE